MQYIRLFKIDHAFKDYSQYYFIKGALNTAMGKFYFVRHGQTVWNVENKICGATDSPLTELGPSPLSRAYDTAKEISVMTGVPMRIEQRLIEQNFGKWEGTARDGKEFARAKQNFCDSFDGGESMMRMAQRIYNLIDDLKRDPEKTYLLVAHNGISRIIESYFHDMTNEEFASFGIRNAQVREYDF